MVALLLLIGGCSQYVDVEPSSEDRENRVAVLSYLESVNESDLLDAFQSLRERSFTRVVETVQFDEDGIELARDERVLVQTASDNGPVSFVASSNADVAFDLGSGSEFFGGAANDSESKPFTPYALPEDRGYNNPRHENKYVYRFGPDETRDGRRFRTVQISVLEAAEEEVFVQKVILVIDSVSARVVSLLMQIKINSLLYGESTILQLDGAWTTESQIEPRGFSLTSEITSALKRPVSIRINSAFSFPEGSL